MASGLAAAAAAARAYLYTLQGSAYELAFVLLGESQCNETRHWRRYRNGRLRLGFSPLCLGAALASDARRLRNRLPVYLLAAAAAAVAAALDGEQQRQ